MAEIKENQNLPASERLKEVALLLKQADKLVKEGDLASALELIVKARSYDSRHLYALAYEERVRTLLNAKQKESEEKSSTAESPSEEPPVENKVNPALQHLSNLAIIEAQHSATVAAQQEKAIELHKKEEEEKTKQEELRRNAIDTKIGTFLARATSYIDRKEYNRALDEIARAYLLDPVNDKIHELEERIRKSLDETKRFEEEEKLRRQEEDKLKREELLKSKTVLLQKEKEEKLKREEEERKAAQQEKVRQYLQHVTELFQAGKLDEALSELAFVIVIDPLNEEVLKLEQLILETQERQQQQQLELYQKQLEERQKKREAILATIKKHIENAELLAKQHKFTEALRTITRATVLDPINDDLQQCESRILAMQEEQIRIEEERKRELHDQIRRQQEEELLRLERADRERVLQGESSESLAKKQADKEKIVKYLERARKFLEEHHFEVALGEVALAFIINPFDDDIKKVEQEILAAREEHQKKNRSSIQQTLQNEQTMKDDTAERIVQHLKESEKFRREKQYSKAFNEVAKAFILDPLNNEIQQYEQALQEEFDRFLADQHNKKEEEEKTGVIRRHINHANEFLQRDLFEEALAEVIAGLTIDEQNSDLLALKETINERSRRWNEHQTMEARNLEIQKYLVSARELLTVGKVDEAKQVITKAVQLDPARPETLSVQSDIDAVLTQLQENAQWEQKSQRVKSHIAQAQSFLMANMLDKALVEILSGLSLDPSNDDLLKLEQRVVTLHDANSASSQKKTISPEEQERLIRMHIRMAAEYLGQKDFAKALDEIAHGLTVDPFNYNLLKLDSEIRKEQTEHDQKVSQGLKLIYSGGKATG
ncbi:MAG: hypothetical protein AB1728_07940 [Bacteroidota bacterium]